jgi:hypothetical protein
MKPKKQIIHLAFHSRAAEAVSVEERHARFFEGIKGLPVPWGLGDRSVPPIPAFKGASVVFSMSKFFGDGVRRAQMTYVYRRMLEDRGSSDDLLIITFNPAKVDVHILICTVIPTYIEALDAYLVEFFDDRFIDLAFEERVEQGRITFTAKSKEYVNPRFKVERVNVVSFYDELLCRRAFNLSPAEVVERLQGKVEIARLLHNGVYVVGSSQVLPFDEARKVCREMTTALLGWQ